MVDFQKRDTRRGYGEANDEESDETDADDEGDADGADGESRDRQDDGDDAPDDQHDDQNDEHDGGDHGRDHHDHGDDRDDSHGDHDHHQHDVEKFDVAVVTVSSSRSLENDPSGDVIVDALEAAGNEVATRQLIADDLDSVQHTLATLVGRDDVDVVVTTGGTGVTPDDVTVEAAEPLFDKELPGFGELFRQLSREAVGTRVVGTRAVGGIADYVPVFCLPGSENAARLGVEEIVLPEAGHLVGLASRDDE